MTRVGVFPNNLRLKCPKCGEPTYYRRFGYDGETKTIYVLTERRADGRYEVVDSDEKYGALSFNEIIEFTKPHKNKK